MISNVITALLEAIPELGLTKGANLFAENATGDQFVLVSGADPEPWAPELIENAGSNLQVLVKGWPFTQGYALSERIKAAILMLEGAHSFGAESYMICDTVWKNGPMPFRDASGAQCFSMNFRIYYHLSLT